MMCMDELCVTARAPDDLWVPLTALNSVCSLALSITLELFTFRCFWYTTPRADWYKVSFGAHISPPPAWKMCLELFSCPFKAFVTHTALTLSSHAVFSFFIQTSGDLSDMDTCVLVEVCKVINLSLKFRLHERHRPAVFHSSAFINFTSITKGPFYKSSYCRFV